LLSYCDNNNRNCSQKKTIEIGWMTKIFVYLLYILTNCFGPNSNIKAYSFTFFSFYTPCKVYLAFPLPLFILFLFSFSFSFSYSLFLVLLFSFFYYGTRKGFIDLIFESVGLMLFIVKFSHVSNSVFDFSYCLNYFFGNGG
jgi:hypothetical protein